MSGEKSPILSCRRTDSYSFLSCILRYKNKPSTARNHNLYGSSALKLSCVSHNALEAHEASSSNYRSLEKASEAKRLIIGIDPGITGALAVISSGANSAFIGVFDLPTYEIKVKKSLRKRMDLEAFSFLIESYSKDIILALVEEVGQIGTKADPFSAFVFGFATGGVHGVLAAHGIRTMKVKPLVWKSTLGLDADKQKSIDKAIKFFPSAEIHLKRKKDHGRAEALLIAYWANKYMSMEKK